MSGLEGLDREHARPRLSRDRDGVKTVERRLLVRSGARPIITQKDTRNRIDRLKILLC
jgi:hypothetical protein